MTDHENSGLAGYSNHQRPEIAGRAAEAKAGRSYAKKEQLATGGEQGDSFCVILEQFVLMSFLLW